jgi:hypothetical protein
MWSLCDSITMGVNGKTPAKKPPTQALSLTDCLIFGGAILGILLGVSLLSARTAIALGVAALAFVVYKLFTTKP